MLVTWVRTVLPVDGSDDLLVLDRGGRMSRISVDADRLTNAAFADEGTRLDRARALELTDE